MPQLISPYDLYGRDSLIFWQGQIAKGAIPTRAELADILEHNADKPLPPWLVETMAASLRGKLKQRRGRKKAGQTETERVRLLWAWVRYGQFLKWLQERDRGHGLTGWSCIRHADWWQGPPHERAARMVQRRYFRMTDWRTILNKLSSQK